MGKQSRKRKSVVKRAVVRVAWIASPSPPGPSSPPEYIYTPTPFTEFVTSEWPDTARGQLSPAQWEQKLQRGHAGIDLLAEAKRASAWEASQKVPKEDHRRFFGNWLANAKAPLKAQATPNAEKTLGMLERMRKGDWKEF